MEYLHTMVRVKNIEESLDFYCDKLGLIEFSRKEVKSGRFTLVFLCAPDDKNLAEKNKKPLLELTYNWDAEEYKGGRNFGHLACMMSWARIPAALRAVKSGIHPTR